MGGSGNSGHPGGPGEDLHSGLPALDGLRRQQCPVGVRAMADRFHQSPVRLVIHNLLEGAASSLTTKINTRIIFVRRSNRKGPMSGIHQ